MFQEGWHDRKAHESRHLNFSTVHLLKISVTREQNDSISGLSIAESSRNREFQLRPFHLDLGLGGKPSEDLCISFQSPKLK